MIKGLKKISTVGMSHDDWLMHRSKSIGGSDAAAIVGMSQYSSPYSVWAEKTGKLPPKEDNEAMRQGRDLEEYVAKRFTEATGKKLRRENSIIINPKYPFAHANVDRLVVGEDAGFEAKTTSVLNLSKFKNGEYPENYYCQCVHYLAVTGAKRWYLGVLILGVGFEWYVIERDEDEIAALMQSEEAFWQYVKKDVPPAVDGTKGTTEALKSVFPTSNDDKVDLFAFDSDLERLESVKKQIKELTTIKDEIENKVKVFMADAGRGESDRFKVSWTSSSRSSFDAKAFASDHPDIDLSDYYNNSISRTFRVSKRKAG